MRAGPSGGPPHLQIPHPISSAESPLPHKVTHSQAPDQEGPPGRPLVLGPHKSSGTLMRDRPWDRGPLLDGQQQAPPSSHTSGTASQGLEPPKSHRVDKGMTTGTVPARDQGLQVRPPGEASRGSSGRPARLHLAEGQGHVHACLLQWLRPTQAKTLVSDSNWTDSRSFSGKSGSPSVGLATAQVVALGIHCCLQDSASLSLPRTPPHRARMPLPPAPFLGAPPLRLAGAPEKGGPGDLGRRGPGHS